MDTKNAVITTSTKSFYGKPSNFRSVNKNFSVVSVNAVLTTLPKISLQSPRMVKKLILFSKNPFFVFPQYVLMDTKNAVITTSPKSFWRKAEKFSLNVQNL